MIIQGGQLIERSDYIKYCWLDIVPFPFFEIVFCSRFKCTKLGIIKLMFNISIVILVVQE